MGAVARRLLGVGSYDLAEVPLVADPSSGFYALLLGAVVAVFHILRVRSFLVLLNECRLSEALDFQKLYKLPTTLSTSLFRC